jgi:hypothetical protein
MNPTPAAPSLPLLTAIAGYDIDQLIDLARYCTINNDTASTVVEEMHWRYGTIADDETLFLAAQAALLADKWMLERFL